MEEQRLSAVRERRRKWWAGFEERKRALCAEVDRGRLPLPDAFDAVVSWEMDTLGLLLSGGTGMGKSRALVALTRRLVCVDFVRIEWVDDWAFGPRAVCAAKECAEGELVASLGSVPVLVWDDFGKVRMTPSVESAVFAVVCERCDRGLPLLVSTQFGPEELAGRFRERETGVAVVRRLREFCRVVKF
jgi:DNA replication protein DnaC